MFAVTASQMEGAEQPKGWCLKQHAGGHSLGLKPRHCSALSAQQAVGEQVHPSAALLLVPAMLWLPMGFVW